MLEELDFVFGIPSFLVAVAAETRRPALGTQQFIPIGPYAQSRGLPQGIHPQVAGPSRRPVNSLV